MYGYYPMEQFGKGKWIMCFVNHEIIRKKLNELLEKKQHRQNKLME